MDDYHASVTIMCTVCRCDKVIEDGWSTVYNSLDNKAAKIVGDQWGLPRNNLNCDGQCPCHTGIGLLPRLNLRIS